MNGWYLCAMKYAQTPEDIAALFVDAWMARDARAFANLFSEDAEFINVVGLWWHNREAIFKAHDYGLKTIFNNSTLKVVRSRIKYLNDTICVIHLKMRLTGQTSHDGIEVPGERRNIISMVLQQFDDRWLCVAAHNTDVVPGMETNIIDSSGKMRTTDYRK